MPPLNSMRVPMENAPAPHLLTQLNPERMYLLGDPRYAAEQCSAVQCSGQNGAVQCSAALLVVSIKLWPQD